jgi:hypothetical protein
MGMRPAELKAAMRRQHGKNPLKSPSAEMRNSGVRRTADLLQRLQVQPPDHHERSFVAHGSATVREKRPAD